MSYSEIINEEVRKLFNRSRPGVFQEVADSAVPQELTPQGEPVPVGWVENADEDSGEATVTINSKGITILNGKLFLIDSGGNSVLGPAGFEGSWLNFLNSGVYNGDFRGGNAVPITAVTEIGTGEGINYIDSISDELPYWVVSRIDADIIAEVEEGSYGERWLRVFNGSVSTIRAFEFYQDIPILSGHSSFGQILYRAISNGTGYAYASVSGEEYDKNHNRIVGTILSESAIHTSPTTLYEDTTASMRVNSFVGGSGGAYLRVTVKAELSPAAEIHFREVVGGPEKRIVGTIASYPEGLLESGNYYEVGPLGFLSKNYKGETEASLSKEALTFLNGTYPGIMVSRGGATANAKLQIEATTDEDNTWVRIASGAPPVPGIPAAAAQLSLGRYGETHDRIFLNSKDDTNLQPSLEFGDGTNPRDLYLYRGGAGQLVVTGYVREVRSGTGLAANVAQVSGDASERIRDILGAASTYIQMGSGTGVPVTVLERTNATGDVLLKGYGRLRFVPMRTVHFNASTTAATIANTLIGPFTNVPSHAKAVQVEIRLRTDTINASNYMVVAHGSSSSLAALTLHAPGVAGYPNATSGVVELNANGKLYYSVNRAAGTLTYDLVITGYWTDDNT